MSREYGSRQFGNYCPWDMVKGLELWMANLKGQDIADALGTTERAVMAAAMRYKWPKRRQRLKPSPKKVVVLKRRCEDCLGVFDGPHDCHLVPIL